MTTLLKTVVLGSAVLGMAACTTETKPRWNAEAGSQLDTGHFGNATMHNTIAQMCNRNKLGGAGYGPKGGMTSDPVVVLDPSSTPQRPIYRLHCSGDLNGKYAQVVFDEYITSAEPVNEEAAISSSTGADATAE